MKSMLLAWIRRLLGKPTHDVFIGYALCVNLPARLEFDFSVPVGATQDQKDAAAFRALLDAANQRHEGVPLSVHIPRAEDENPAELDYHPNVDYLWWQHA